MTGMLPQQLATMVVKMKEIAKEEELDNATMARQATRKGKRVLKTHEVSLS